MSEMLVLEHNGCSIKFDFGDEKKRMNALTRLCEAMLKAHSVPPQRIYVYVANEEHEEFTHPQSVLFQGEYFRGFMVGQEEMPCLPPFLKECAFRPDKEIEREFRYRDATISDRLAVDYL